MKWSRLGILFVAAASLICAAFLFAGCGGSETVDTAAPPAATPPAHQAASGPAVDAPLELEQFAPVLESPITRTKDANGLEFLKFKYADDDGKIYLCVLPASLATGKHKWSAWVSTFNIYRKSDVLGQKSVDKSKENLTDFPYISPKPQEQPKQQQRPNVTVPIAPMAPSGPPITPGPPSGPMPGPMPGPPGPGTRPMPPGPS